MVILHAWTPLFVSSAHNNNNKQPPQQTNQPKKNKKKNNEKYNWINENTNAKCNVIEISPLH